MAIKIRKFVAIPEMSQAERDKGGQAERGLGGQAGRGQGDEAKRGIKIRQPPFLFDN